MARATCLLLLFIAPSLAAGAVTRYVAPSGTDIGDCSSAASPCATITYAVSQALSGDEIAVAPGTYAGAVTLDRDVDVVGAGQGTTTTMGAVSINAGVSATMRSLTVQGAAVVNNGEATLERVTVQDNTNVGIRNNGTMTITAGIVRGNANLGNGLGGGIRNTGTLTVVESLIEGNRALEEDDLGEGGGLLNEGTATILRSTIRDNVADGGGAFTNGHKGGEGTLTIIGSTIADNRTRFQCGAGKNGGTATLLNSTVSGNEGGLCNFDEMTVEFTTVTNNTNDLYWGYGAIVNTDTFRFRNTILAGNEDDCTPHDDSNQPLTSLDYNLIGDLGACTIDGATDHTLIGVDPMLMPLADNGGPTLTHAPLDGSPAIDAGACTDIAGNAVTQDQRGLPRPIGSACDIGSVEFGGLPPALTLTPEDPPVVIPASGGAFAFTASITNLTAATQTLDAWVEATQPDGEVLVAPYGPLLGPVAVVLGPGETVERTLVQRVPAEASEGTWTYTGFIGAYPDAAVASAAFPVTKVSAAWAAGPSAGAPTRVTVEGAGWSMVYAESGRPVAQGDIWTPTATPAAAAAGAGVDVPATYAMRPAYPNPLSQSATLRYGLPESAQVRLAVYDLLGREVAVLVDAERESGWHAVHLDASDLAAGPYLYTLTAGDFRATGRLTVLK